MGTSPQNSWTLTKETQSLCHRISQRGWTPEDGQKGGAQGPISMPGELQLFAEVEGKRFKPSNHRPGKSRSAAWSDLQVFFPRKPKTTLHECLGRACHTLFCVDEVGWTAPLISPKTHSGLSSPQAPAANQSRTSSCRPPGASQPPRAYHPPSSSSVPLVAAATVFSLTSEKHNISKIYVMSLTQDQPQSTKPST